eukprot:g26876.t1
MKNAPATFQRLMNRVVAGLTNCAIYIDDLVIFSHSWKDHIVYLAELFERLWEAKLVISLAKTEIVEAEMTSLGHNIRHGRMTLSNMKTKAIDEFPRPSLKKE